MNILETLKQLRDDIKLWVTNNLNALNAKIDEKTIPIDSKLSTTSTNPVQNKTITEALNNVPRFSGDYNDLANAPNIAEDDSGSLVIADEAGNAIFKADADGIHTTALSLNGEAAATENYVDEAIAGIDFPETDLTNYYTKEETDSAINAAKEEISESIVSESSEWKITDGDGNIIFSVDAEGAHTTSLTLNGEAAATETYVDNAIAAIPDVDLGGYATEKYVDDAIAAIPPTDFTGYATEQYVNDAIAAIPETDLSDYYTKEETNNAIESAKEELSEAITSPNSEWAVTDGDGNVIFKVDADGAHTTDLTLNGESVNSIIDTRVAALVDSAPGTLDTLNELAAALGDDPNFATTVATQIGNKVDKETGKGLSTNDFTNEYKTKLDGLENLVETDPTVPAWAKAENPPTYTAEDVGALPSNTPLFSGDYNDLRNAPNISEDNAGNLVIADNEGNIIFRSDANGFETTNLVAQTITINGSDLIALIKAEVKAYVEEYILGGEW
jgi:hypothetical protein